MFGVGKSLILPSTPKEVTSSVWRTPDRTWVVRVRSLDSMGRRVTSFIGPYTTRATARTTQRCIRQMLRWL